MLTGPLVFDAIRAVHPKTPIIINGGHLHIRDCGPYTPLFPGMLCTSPHLYAWDVNSAARRPINVPG